MKTPHTISLSEIPNIAGVQQTLKLKMNPWRTERPRSQNKGALTLVELMSEEVSKPEWAEDTKRVFANRKL